MKRELLPEPDAPVSRGEARLMLINAAVMVCVILPCALLGVWSFTKWWSFVEANAPFLPGITALVFTFGIWALANEGLARVLGYSEKPQRVSGAIFTLASTLLYLLCLFLPGTDKAHLVDWLKIDQ